MKKDDEDLSPQNEALLRLSTIKESLSMELEGESESKSPTFKAIMGRAFATPDAELEFDNYPKDDLLEQLNIVAIKMDIHRTGSIYLKELDIVIKQLQPALQQPIADVLLGYMRRSKALIITVANFVKLLEVEIAKNSSLKATIQASKELINDNDLENILRKVRKIVPSKKIKTKEDSSTHKYPSKATLVTLKEKIEAQKVIMRKKELKSSRSNVLEKQQALRNTPKTSPSRKLPSTSNSASSCKSIQAKIGIVKDFGEQSVSKKFVTQFVPKANSHFDKPNYIKSINILSSPRRSVADQPLAQEMLQKNSVKEISKKFPPKKDALPTEEQKLKNCTFKPKRFKPRLYSNVESKVKASISPKLRHLHRALSPDVDNQNENSSLLSGKNGAIYNSRSTNNLRSLLKQGYSFIYEEKKLYNEIEISGTEQKNDSFQHSRISKNRIGSAENSYITSNSFLQEITKPKAQGTDIYPSQFSSEEQSQHQSRERSILNLVTPPQFKKLKDLHAKYAERRFNHKNINQQRGDIE